MESWIFPLTILPGIGLIIMSTTNWSVALANEIDTLFANPECDKDILKKKTGQLTLINLSLVSFYLSVTMCVLAGFAGSINRFGELMLSHSMVTIMVIAGIAFLLAGTSMLIVFAYRAVRIKKRQFLERL